MDDLFAQSAAMLAVMQALIITHPDARRFAEVYMEQMDHVGDSLRGSPRAELFMRWAQGFQALALAAAQK
ncbi:hypothetical protein FN976_07930 [Caenimonas sedimenti]|uniref:Uncharacterized protein n=1 Tax=Caenimonas sedimenti TaxID=2596921 RepID=A0A562ZU52_9BURK|nr:hypothetical protein FN976_07930 [Caenimonas sedimenti]